MFGLGTQELIIIALIVLLVFGARRIPEIMGGFGKGIREFKRSMNDIEREIRTPAEPTGSLGTGSADRLQRAEPEKEPTEPKRLMN
jgi:sec-independent protein translocase protein TatA